MVNFKKLSDEEERAKHNAENLLAVEKNKISSGTGGSNNPPLIPGRVLPLEDLDRKYSFNDVKTKITLRREGERSFLDVKSKQKVEYGALNGVVIKGPAKFNEMDKSYSMDIPVLVMARFLEWLDLPENCDYFNSILDAEIVKNTGIRRRAPRVE
ncbi:MAG: hypothetical protein O8C61_05505 [Candidatus Methanoperedens sp.]|nr:hypothetical protein [Candidatus Methanoperedens sp.]